MEKNKLKLDTKTIFICLNIMLALSIVLGDICYITFGTLLAKSLTSALFVLLGGVNLLYLIIGKNNNLKFPIIMLVGLAFAMCGDIVLDIKSMFIFGAALFAIGHIFYFVAYCFLQKFKWVDLIYGAAIFIPAVIFITAIPIFDFGGVLMEIVCVVYAIIISCMVGKAISNLVEKRTVQNIIIVIGSILFFFSDLMLLLNIFASLPRVVGVLCLATYYPAEFLLGYSIFVHKNKESEKLENK